MILKNKENLLPYDGTAFYLDAVFDTNQCKEWMQSLLNEIEWQQDELIIFGKKVLAKRQVAWYGDQPFKYTYSKSTKFAKLWTKNLEDIRNALLRVTEIKFNACLLNLYTDGTIGIGWHSDDEPEMVLNSPIASVSLGAARKFIFRHKVDNHKVSVLLENGSVLLMKGSTQQNWQHSVPVTRQVCEPRINLTFRVMH